MDEAKNVVFGDFYKDGYHFGVTFREGATQAEVIAAFNVSDLMAVEAKGRGYKQSWNEETNGKHTVAATPTVQSTEIPVCGVHGKPMVKIPAGISAKTGKPYNAFYTCAVKNADGTRCSYKPARPEGERTPF